VRNGWFVSEYQIIEGRIAQEQITPGKTHFKSNIFILRRDYTNSYAEFLEIF
jgi:hypothetical protein